MTTLQRALASVGVVLAICVALSLHSDAQAPSASVQKNLRTTTCPGAGCVDLALGGLTNVAIQVSGTFNGTITFEASADNNTFLPLLLTPSDGTSATATTSSTGLWSGGAGGYVTVRAIFTGYNSGTAATTISAGGTSPNLLSSNNVWTGTQTFENAVCAGVCTGFGGGSGGPGGVGVAYSLDGESFLAASPLPVSLGGLGVASIPVGQVLFGAGSSLVGSSSNLTFDGTRLGIGSMPLTETALSINSNVRFGIEIDNIGSGAGWLLQGDLGGKFLAGIENDADLTVTDGFSTGFFSLSALEDNVHAFYVVGFDFEGVNYGTAATADAVVGFQFESTSGAKSGKTIAFYSQGTVGKSDSTETYAFKADGLDGAGIKRFVDFNSGGFYVDSNDNLFTDADMQIGAIHTAAPAGGDCDASGETGKYFWDSTNDNLYICSGASGWRKITTGAP